MLNNTKDQDSNIQRFIYTYQKYYPEKSRKSFHDSSSSCSETLE